MELEHRLTRLSLPFSIPEERYNQTDYDRIYAELIDLPYKKGYAKWFRVKVKSSNPKDLLFPLLHIEFKGKWYPFQLVLAGYPHYIDGYFLVIPPCPVHHKSHHPHVFSSGDVCWEVEQNWESGMTLYGDYIKFLREILYYPKEHVLCR
jgi:hypothetical protein